MTIWGIPLKRPTSKDLFRSGLIALSVILINMAIVYAGTGKVVPESILLIGIAAIVGSVCVDCAISVAQHGIKAVFIILGIGLTILSLIKLFV
ncbi:hypothetical protein A3715_10295 [Oleiphilus sp. HI0009]|nr:hypothetical protein A3715_20620 [Oleiphilus sp. HI0009]KZX78248.1 hypothetical protein A3715_10295 [Oleiphilus sp. HI0009]